MSREARLGVGVLLIVVALLIASLPILAGEPSKAPETMAVLVAIFGVPGLALFVWGMIPGLGSEGRKYIRLRFLPGRVVAGLCVTAGSALTLYLFNEVVHVAPRVVLIGALLGLPAGILWAAMAWAEWCIRCDDEVDRAADGRRYCSGCRAYVRDPRTRQLVTGAQATAMIETLLRQSAPSAASSGPSPRR